jgi:hypothetical protein
MAKQQQHTEHPAYALLETFSGIAKNLTPEQMVYWTRNSAHLNDLLTRDQVTFIGEECGSFTIPALPAGKNAKALVGGPFGRSEYNLVLLHHVGKEHPSTPAATVHYYHVQCYLYPGEVVEYLGGIDTMMLSYFTIPQIRASLRGYRYPQKRWTGPFAPHGNYFPVLIGKGIEMLNLYWNTERNAWELSKVDPEKYLWRSRLFLKSDSEPLE